MRPILQIEQFLTQHSYPGGLGAKGKEGWDVHTQQKKKLIFNVFYNNSKLLKKEKASFPMS